MFDGPADSVKNAPITLSRTSALYVALILLVVLPVLGMFAFSDVIDNAWCEQFEIPDYEELLGFKMGPIPVPDGKQAKGLTWVDPAGPLGKAGIRAGDFPRIHHGMSDFCGDLASVADRRPVQIEVVNVADLGKGAGSRRLLTIIGPRQ